MHYRSKAHEPGVTEKIVDMEMNGSGVRDTGRVLGISPTTVIKTQPATSNNNDGSGTLGHYSLSVFLLTCWETELMILANYRIPQDHKLSL
jgi:hypothetical protein